MSTSTKPIISFRNIEKRFGVSYALRDVSFDVARGSVHALVGENGAGKSTLLNIASGSLVPNGGEVMIDGVPTHISSPRKAASLGVAMIHQELAGLEYLTIAENILLGHEPRRASGLLLDYREMNRVAEQYMRQLNMQIAVTTPLGELTVGQQQMVEIAKALSLDARLLIMDEPTSALSEREIAALFAVIEQLASSKITVVYISHRLEEIFRICDTITVLRDGRHIQTAPISTVNGDAVVKMMIGEDMGAIKRRVPAYTKKNMLKTEQLCCEGLFKDISLTIREGEVFGLFGLLGSGRTELAYALYGMAPAMSGTVAIDGQRVTLSRVSTARSLGVAYAPEDRKQQALFPNHSVRRNIIVGIVRRLAKLLWVPKKAAAARAREMVRDFDVRVDSVDAAVGRLSGGNQQKVVLSRWIAANPKLLILDEPTRGIDVKAKAQIYELVDRLAQQGMSILLISSELPEIFRVSDTIGVLRNGELVAVQPYDSISAEEVMQYAAGKQDEE